MSIKSIPIRVWIVIIAVVLAIFAINPSPWAKGVEIKSVEAGGVLSEQGITANQMVLFINEMPIKTMEDYDKAIAPFANKPKNITVTTSAQKYNYIITDDFGFDFDQNLTVLETEDYCPLGIGEVIKGVNSEKVSDVEGLNKILDSILPKKKLLMLTDKNEFAMLVRGKPKMSVGPAKTSNIKTGLDLRGGTRVVLRPIAESGEAIEDNNVADIISVLDNRLNVYGLSDMKIRSAKDWEGNKFVIVEIAGATREEVKELIGKQGKFEAKIGNDTVFVGGKKDITFVCRGDGTCSGIRQCNPSGPSNWGCRFEFAIHLSPEAAKLHAEITKKLDVVLSNDGKEILSKNLDFYLDGKKVDSLQISSDLKGSETTAIAISGPGSGPTKVDAGEDALKSMGKLQTILITGSLPFKLETEKMDTISPSLGRSFVNNSLLVGLLAIIAVAIVIILRYKKFIIIFPVMITSITEIFLTLGFASLIGWNLDIVSIAGIIAAVGTGVDDQIIIVDEAIKGRGSGNASSYNWLQRIKRAFFVIFTVYATLIAAMLPLWNAGAGLLRGFAVTTIIGVTIGVFVTRPAFAVVVEKLLKD